MKQTSCDASVSCYPVLSGLANAGFAGKSLAEIAGVTPPTLSKWRTGRLQMPGSRLALLTLVLAHLLEEIEAMENRIGNMSAHHEDEKYFGDLHRELRGCLHEQEIRNLALAPAAVHAGARLYRTWYEETGGAALNAMTNLADNRFRKLNFANMVTQ